VIRVHIVAAAARARRGLEALLQSQGFEVVGAFAALEDAGDEFGEKGLDAIVVDASDVPVEEFLGSLQESGVARETPVILLLPGA
jgi:DNA-binding response OmpR family regulator